MDNETLPEVDFESKYSANTAMEEAVGYDNLTERMANPEKSQELAHKEPIDKLLSDYFIQQRQMHKSSNTLQKDLNSLFSLEQHKDKFSLDLEGAGYGSGDHALV